MRQRFWVWLLLTAPCGALALAQEQSARPQFKTDVQLMRLDVSVVDGRHRPIRGLQASDFTVLEDGKPRPVRVFQAITLPPAPARSDAAQPSNPMLAVDSGSSVTTNQIANQDGRLVFILMDRTIPTGQPVLAASKIATEAINALGPSDLAAIVTTGGNVPQTLTADRARLLKAVNQGDWSTGPSPEQKEILARYDPFGGKYDSLSDGRCLCGLCVLETVTNLAEAARETPSRRKLLLFIGSSIIVQAGPTPASADVGCDNRVRDARRKMVDALALAHLTVDSIDPSGLATAMVQGSGNGLQGQNGPAFRRQNLLDNTIRRLQDQGNLDVLPDFTGGRTFTNSNAPEQAVPDIFQESSSYYIVGFEPSAEAGAKRRSIEVKVATAGAHVSTVRAVLPQQVSDPESAAANRDAARSPLDRALGGLLPDAHVPLQMSLAAFAGPDASKAYVSVSLNAAAFGVDAQRAVDLAVLVYDRRGRSVASVREGAVTIRQPGTLQTHVMLAPGDYELRAGVQTRDTGVAASVFSQLTVPAFGDSPLAMSDLVIGMRPNPNPPSDADAPDIPVIVSTARTFHRGQAAWAFGHVYEGTQKRDPLQPVEIRTIVSEASGRVVRTETATMGTDAFVGRHLGVRIRVPIASLPPGKYVLRVEAARRDSRMTITRAVAYEVD